MISYKEFLLLRAIKEKAQGVLCNSFFAGKKDPDFQALCKVLFKKGYIKVPLKEDHISFKEDHIKKQTEEKTAGIDLDCSLTQAGEEVLGNFKVDNAIILAAGLSKRFAPLSYESPKGLYKVKGEILIERQIRQLQEAGIKKIYVVVGYKQEQFFYLEDAFGVEIVVNPEFAQKNNHSSLYVVRDKLHNSYICSSDIYNQKNPFHAFEYGAFYAAQFCAEKTEEWVLNKSFTRDMLRGASQGEVKMDAESSRGGSAATLPDPVSGANDVLDQKMHEAERFSAVADWAERFPIKEISIGGDFGWVMAGHAYFDQAFSRVFTQILEREYNRPETAGKLWENLLADHLEELNMDCLPFPQNMLYEFDSLDDLLQFDPLFLENVDSVSIDNITNALGCERAEIHDVFPMTASLTNLSCHFATASGEYVYRYPGSGTDQIIDRYSELEALIAAKDAGLDSTFITADAKGGWKISRYIKNARTLNPHDEGELKTAMQYCRILHETDIMLKRTFEFFEEAERYVGILQDSHMGLSSELRLMRETAVRLHEAMNGDDAPTTLTHNDFFYENFLIDEAGNFNLIDWEYAGMGDYANDFATFAVTCELSKVEIDKALEFYFQGKPTEAQYKHNIAMIGLCGWCWYLWSLVKNLSHQFIGETQYSYYRYAKRYLKEAAALYGLAA